MLTKSPLQLSEPAVVDKIIETVREAKGKK
jgi:hypothetical protein